DAAEFDWASRAAEYDVDRITTAGDRVYLKITAALEMTADVIVKALADGSVKPESWAAILHALELLTHNGPVRLASQTVRAGIPKHPFPPPPPPPPPTPPPPPPANPTARSPRLTRPPPPTSPS